MPAEVQKLKESWKKSTSDEKYLLILVFGILMFLFFPWESYSYGQYGSIVYFSRNGLRSYGNLTFLGSILYLAVKILPMAGIKIPDMGMEQKMMEKILAGAIFAGPVLWLLSSNFYFSIIGFGFWVDLVLSGFFSYLVFTEKKFSEVKTLLFRKKQK
ncbi:hypothetical protein HZA38_03850 [Candidatus Peregrinibacteria bacterium]|nr:hypothetical protein [Candidatus Peregrinibacteria bacterium]